MLSGWVVETRSSPRKLAHALYVAVLAGIIAWSVYSTNWRQHVLSVDKGFCRNLVLLV